MKNYSYEINSSIIADTPENKKRPLVAIIKPTHKCNLACKYCYVPENASKGVMSEKVLISTMVKVAEASPEKKVTFIWHGGEPLLMGLDFFVEVSKISNELRKNGFNISNAIQTNATLIDNDFLNFFQQINDFHIGTSLDGPREINDKVRIFPGGESCFDAAFSGILEISERRYKNGKRMGGGAIAVISKANVKSPQKMYSFFRKHNINIKFNILVSAGHATNELSITPVQYAEFFKKTFRLWYNSNDTLRVSTFIDLIDNLIYGSPCGCNFVSSCADTYLSIGPSGDIYPCGRFEGIKEYYLGNVDDGENGVENAITTKTHRYLTSRKNSIYSSCKNCRYGRLCYGGCMHNAFLNGDILGKDPFCVAYKKIYKYVEHVLHKEFIKAEAKNENTY